MTLEELRREALALSPKRRAALAHDIVVSLEGFSPEALESLWLDEVERRDREMDEGSAAGIPGDEVFARLRARRA
jgi:putative addiction module component (TIGR02574 family)